MSAPTLPDWEHLLSAAAHLQKILPGATLVGGTAAAIYAGHRVSYDDDHVLLDLRGRFDDILAQLESVAGWRTARVTRPVVILGSLDGIETLDKDAPTPRTTQLSSDGRIVAVAHLGGLHHHDERHAA